ncbi:MAG: cytochrome c1, partial [Burkholderiales bacterium]
PEGEHGSFEKATTKYDAMGFATTTTEALKDYHGHGSSTYTFKALDPLRSAAYDNDVADLTSFLAWMSEPFQLKRKQIGVWVMLFLGLFLVVAMRLNHSFWKHVK